VNLLYGHDGIVADFVAKSVPGLERGFGACKTIGVLDNGNLIAGLVYHNWNPESGVIEISGSALNPRWLTREVLREMFDYPFKRCGCQMVVMRVSEHNKRLHRQLKAYGFKSYEIPRLRGRKESEIIFTLTDDDWQAGKFMRSPNGKTKSTAAA